LNSTRSILHVSLGEDPLYRLAEHILNQQSGHLPDLSRHVVLFPLRNAIPRFRRILIRLAEQSGFPALLPPYIGSLDNWLRQFTDLDADFLNDSARELILYQAISDLPELRKRVGAWSFIESLFSLFDEMIHHHCRFPEDVKDFYQVIRTAYGATHATLAPMDNEARLVQSLWLAWRKHLTDNRCQDTALLKLSRINKSLALIPKDTILYLAGFNELTRVETEWIEALRKKDQRIYILYTSINKDDQQYVNALPQTSHTMARSLDFEEASEPYAIFLKQVFAHSHQNLMERAHELCARFPISPAVGRLAICPASSMEQEARTIDLQVRRWRLRGLNNIGIVTNDRKLARRVRALLERANIHLNDAGGWALSTTSAATALMRWLECLEHNFISPVLLDLLRSPFISLGMPISQLKRYTTILEQSVILRNNIVAGVNNYRIGLKHSRPLLVKNFGDETYTTLTVLLDRIETAAKPLQSVMFGGARPANNFPTALTLSMELLGLAKSFAEDDAGVELLDTINELHASLKVHPHHMRWSEFSSWLRYRIERSRYRPSQTGCGVELMELGESRLHYFDALVIAACTREHMPGGGNSTPFFNDKVRQQLGLPGQAARTSTLFHDFRRLLHAAPNVLVTLQQEEQGETSIPSPWIERLRAFHEIAYGQSLEDRELSKFLQSGIEPVTIDDAPLPLPMCRPAPKLSPSLVPQVISTTAHQRLLDCPYLFYVAHCLNIFEGDEIHDEMEKSEYGERVHKIMQAFHSGTPGLPGPWNQQLTNLNRAAAETLLREISQRVFANDLRLDYSAHGWLHRWQRLIPAYLDWTLDNGKDWETIAAELVKQERVQVGDHSFTLTGRIDRLDRGPSGFRLIDYKTGAVPTSAKVASGEHAQLSYYTLLLRQEVHQALFLSLSHDRVRDTPNLIDKDLHALTEAVNNRLLSLLQALTQQTALPAWGDNDICAQCAMEGLCRKEFWQTEHRVA
jgi:ATP-dependent helicase/nuclease subunit B